MIYPCGNLEGRYRRGGENADDYARGARQWTVPWGNHGGNDFINTFPHNQYCLKYGGHHDDLAPFVINQHKNGMLTPWGFNATHGIEPITVEDYKELALHPQSAADLGLRPPGAGIDGVPLHHGGSREGHAAAAGLRAEPFAAQLQAAQHAGGPGRDRDVDRSRGGSGCTRAPGWALPTSTSSTRTTATRS